MEKCDRGWAENDCRPVLATSRARDVRLPKLGELGALAGSGTFQFRIRGRFSESNAIFSREAKNQRRANYSFVHRYRFLWKETDAEANFYRRLLIPISLSSRLAEFHHDCLTTGVILTLKAYSSVRYTNTERANLVNWECGFTRRGATGSTVTTAHL